ncbi:MAG TPA: serine protease [Gemmatimonadaceae bacterium]|nr:serine protease [Gemmatimonadaceae bacterium]
MHPASRVPHPATAALTALTALLVATPLAAQTPTTSDVFRRYADQVVKVEIAESGAKGKASLGSGFYVDAAGHVVTNYHVISQIVHHPDRYSARLVDNRGGSRAAEVLAVDVVHDLAVLRSPQASSGGSAGAGRAAFLALAPGASLSQGEHLFAMGHPHDLGLSIVEGTYNGLLQHTLYPRIHFTGSLNPGMSGGPTLDAEGRVVGVNVSTAGNQVSFLVPVERVQALLARATAAGYAPPTNAKGEPAFLGDVARQIRAYQHTYLGAIFARDSGGSATGGRKPPTVALGPYTLPTEPAPFFKCWGDADQSADEPYHTVNHTCSTDDYLFIAGDHASGIVGMEHELITSDRLNALRFYALYARRFSGSFVSMGGGDFGFDGPTSWGSKDEVTKYVCRTRNVRNASLTLRAAFCVRRYRKLAGLYDAVLKAAVVGANRRDGGLVTTLTLSGVSFENAQRVAERYLESIAWTPKSK